ncbi:hypothetical protein Tco_0168507 [Tanacetum coccineum]
MDGTQVIKHGFITVTQMSADVARGHSARCRWSASLTETQFDLTLSYAKYQALGKLILTRASSSLKISKSCTIPTRLYLNGAHSLVIKPRDGTFVVEQLDQTGTSLLSITPAEDWDAQMALGMIPGNQARAAKNRKTRAKEHGRYAGRDPDHLARNFVMMRW